ncbi:hypothetical protein QUF50_01925 [Thiotrichales bacterium HSG1]|nr:hypothetical protein [Thiotrichales bacterium HSG1]
MKHLLYTTVIIITFLGYHALSKASDYTLNYQEIIDTVVMESKRFTTDSSKLRASDEYKYSLLHDLAQKNKFETISQLIGDSKKMPMMALVASIYTLEDFSAYEVLRHIVLDTNMGHGARDMALECLGRSKKYNNLLIGIVKGDQFNSIKHTAVKALGEAEEYNLLKSISSSDEYSTLLRETALQALFEPKNECHCQFFLKFLASKNNPLTSKEEVVRLIYLGSLNSYNQYSKKMKQQYQKTLIDIHKDSTIPLTFRNAAKIYILKLQKQNPTLTIIDATNMEIETNDPDLRIKNSE